MRSNMPKVLLALLAGVFAGRAGSGKKQEGAGVTSVSEPIRADVAPVLSKALATDAFLLRSIENLTKRARHHRRLGLLFLGCGLLSAVLSMTVLYVSGGLLLDQLAPASHNKDTLRSIETRIAKLQADIAIDKTELGKKLKNLRDGLPASGLWVQRDVPQLTSEMNWVGVIDTSVLAVGDTQFAYKDSKGTWSIGVTDDSDFQAHGSGFMWSADSQWVGGSNGQIARLDPSQGRRRWITSDIEGAEEKGSINSIFFRDASVGWAVGSGGLLASTIDGGETWKRIVIPTDANLLQIRFFNDGTGVIVGDDLTMFVKFPDSPEWRDQRKDLTGALGSPRKGLGLKAVSVDPVGPFGNAAAIVAGGTDGVILVGRRAGPGKIAWSCPSLVKNATESQPLDGRLHQAILRGIEKMGGASGYVAVGDGGTFLYSSNDGASWRSFDLRLPSLYYVQSTGASNVRVVGDRETIAQVGLADVNNAHVVIEHDVRARGDGSAAASTGTGAINQVSNSSQGTLTAVGQSIWEHLTPPPQLSLLSTEEDDSALTSEILQAKWESIFLKWLPEGAGARTTIASAHDGITKLDAAIKDQARQVADLGTEQTAILSRASISSNDFLLWTTAARGFLTLVTFFVMRYLVNLARTNNVYATFCDARADALLAMLVLPGSVESVGAFFMPGASENEAPEVTGVAAMLGLGGKAQPVEKKT